MRHAFRILATTLGLLMATGAMAAEETVTFMSLHDNVELVGYLFLPERASPVPAAPLPAVILLHGRGGPYSSAARGVYTAKTLSQRHRQWAERWAGQGYAALIVDGFGPRGYPAGFERGTYDNRPAEIDETVARPQDAYAALVYLRQRREIASDRVGLMGWSNGGSAVLAALAADAPGLAQAGGAAKGFRAGLAFYPGCALKNKYRDGLVPYAPVRIFAAEQDEEVSPKICVTLATRSRAKGADLTVSVYPGAVHGFDDPGRERQAVAANRTATEDATRQALAFFAERLK